MRQAPTTSAPELAEFPRLFGSVALLKPMARTARNETYLALRKEGIDRLCVVTLLAPEMVSSESVVDGLRAQATWLVTRIHGNLVQVYDVGQTEEEKSPRLFVVSEYVEGLELGSLLEARRADGAKMPVGPALYVALAIGEAFEFLRTHEAAVTGVQTSLLGLGPASVLLSREGLVKVHHCGSCLAIPPEALVKSDAARASLLAPEQMSGGGSASGDVYALGALLWQMISGYPLAGDDVPAHLEQLRTRGGLVPPPSSLRKDGADVPGALDRLILRSLAHDPKARPADFSELRGEIVALMKKVPGASPAGLAAFVSQSMGRSAQQGSTGEITALVDEGARLLGNPETVAPEKRHRAVTLTSMDRLSQPSATSTGAELKPHEIIPGTRYRALVKLGEGGMGAVYAAEHVDIEKKVAVKILHPDLLRNPMVLQQFRQEARAASKIGNPYICDVTDWGEMADGRVFFVMEFLDGVSLNRAIKKARCLPPARALPILRQVSKALGAAHEKGIVHLDVKPDNVLLMDREGRGDRVKVVDFGIAGLLGQGGSVTKVMGTPEYMAPERAQGRGYDHRSDIYALGCMAYEMLTGDVPFQGPNAIETLAMHVNDPVDRLNERLREPIPEAIESAVLRLLEKDPARRPQTMAEVETLLVGAQIEARVRTLWDDLPLPDMDDERAARFRGWLSAAAHKSRVQLYVLSGVAAVSVAVSLVMALRDPEPERALAITSVNAGEMKRTIEKSTETKGPTIVPLAVHPAPPPAPPPSPIVSVVPEPRRPGGSSSESHRRSRDEGAAPDNESHSARSADDVARASVLRGSQALSAFRFEMAKKAFEEALGADTRNAAAYAGLAEVSFQEARYDQAAAHARKAARYAPRSAKYLVLLGDSLQKLKKMKEALGAYENALRVAPDDADIARLVEETKSRVSP